MQNLVYEWVDFSKVPQIWAKIGSSLRNLEKSGDFDQNLAKNWTDWYMNGSLFLENWYLYGSTFKFRGGTSLPKQNLSTPPHPGPYPSLRVILAEKGTHF